VNHNGGIDFYIQACYNITMTEQKGIDPLQKLGFALGIGVPLAMGIGYTAYGINLFSQYMSLAAESWWDQRSELEKLGVGAGLAVFVGLLWRALNIPVYRNTTTFFQPIPKGE
jgi:hypothetical protein